MKRLRRALAALLAGMAAMTAGCASPAPVPRRIAAPQPNVQQQALVAASAIAKRDAQTHFQSFDRDRDQQLSATEFVEGLTATIRREADDALDAGELAQLRRDAAQEFDALDQDRSKSLTFTEFARRYH